MKVTDFVKNSREAEFFYYRKGFFYYMIHLTDVEDSLGEYDTYVFPIPQEDLGDASLYKKEKAIHLMRYIRKAIDEGTMVKQTI